MHDVVALAPNLIQGIQLNMVWPDPTAVKAFKIRNPKIKIILQVGSRALEMVDRQPRLLSQKLQDYKGVADFVLLDDSAGFGKAMDPEFLLPFVRHILTARLDMRVGVAGGLCKSNLHLITPIVESCPDVSIDAEGNIRNKVEDVLDMKEVSAYLVSSFEFFVYP